MPNITQFRLLEEYAESVLNRFQERFDIGFQPPIPIESIAEDFLKLRCESRNLSHPSGGSQGAFLANDGVIFSNEHCNEGRRRFTIAHEIGHWVLSNIEGDLKSVVYGIRGNEGQGVKAKLRETAAHRIAGALLMTLPQLSLEARKYTTIDDKAVIELADTFQVSPTAMLVRIKYITENGESLGRRLDSIALNRLKATLSGGHRPKQKESTRNHSQRTFNDIRPFYPGQYGTEYSEAVWAIISVLTHLGVSSFGRDEKHDTAKAPAEVLGRPLVIEFAGMPNTGKDTQIEIISEYLSNIHGYRVKIIEEGYRHSPVESPRVYGLYWMLGTTLRNLAEVTDRSYKHDVVILNRGPFDNLAFLHLYNSQGYINKREAKTHATTLVSKNLRELVDVVFLLKTTPNASLRREQAHPRKFVAKLAREFAPLKPPYPAQNLVNEAGLDLLDTCYEHAFDKYGKLFKYIYQLRDDGGRNIEQTSVDLMSQLHSKIPINHNPVRKPPLLRQRKLIPAAEEQRAQQLTFSEF